MATGLHIYDASGTLILDETTYVGRALGLFQTGTSDGSYIYAGVVHNKIYATIVDGGEYSPSITVDGNKISWKFPFTGKNTTILIFEI